MRRLGPSVIKLQIHFVVILSTIRARESIRPLGALQRLQEQESGCLSTKMVKVGNVMGKLVFSALIVS